DAAVSQPVGEGFQVGGKGPEPADWLGLSVGGDANPMSAVVDVDPGGVGILNGEGRAWLGPALGRTHEDLPKPPRWAPTLPHPTQPVVTAHTGGGGGGAGGKNHPPKRERAPPSQRLVGPVTNEVNAASRTKLRNGHEAPWKDRSPPPQQDTMTDSKPLSNSSYQKYGGRRPPGKLRRYPRDRPRLPDLGASDPRVQCPFPDLAEPEWHRDPGRTPEARLEPGLPARELVAEILTKADAQGSALDFQG